MNGETERAERRRLRNDLLFAAQMLAFYRSIGAGGDAARYLAQLEHAADELRRVDQMYFDALLAGEAS
jgi:hypothetical protein